MKGNQKVILTIVSVIFFVTLGMFIYQNIYLKVAPESAKTEVYFAKKDIPKGAEFTKDFLEKKKIDKDSVKDSYILTFEELEGKTANSDIYKDEIITESRIEKNDNASEQFSINVTPTSVSNINKGDTVRVYLQIMDKDTKDIKLYEVMDKKVVKKIKYEATASGKINKNNIESLELEVSDKEALNYYNASKLGDIIVLKYNDLSVTNKEQVLPFNYNLTSYWNSTSDLQNNSLSTDSSK